MFHGIINYLIVSLVFSHLGFWSGNPFLIAPFPGLCLLVPFYFKSMGGNLPILNFRFVISRDWDRTLLIVFSDSCH